MSRGFIPLVFFFFFFPIPSVFMPFWVLAAGQWVSVMGTGAHGPLEKSAPSHILQECVHPIDLSLYLLLLLYLLVLPHILLSW